MSKKIFLYPGHIHATREETWVSTLLGSCVAVALYDEKQGIGGLNHFLLPVAEEVGSSPSPRYGDYAISTLVEKLVDLGADRQNLKAKLYGGACVLPGTDCNEAVGKKNIDYAERALAQLGIPVVEKEVGGDHARTIQFNTRTAQVKFKLTPSHRSTSLKKVS